MIYVDQLISETWICQVVAGFLSDNLLSGLHLHLYIPHIANVIGTIMAMIYYHSVEMWNSPRFLLLFMPYWLASTIIEGMKASNLNIRGLSQVYMRPHLTRTSIVVYCLLCLIELDVLRQLVSAKSCWTVFYVVLSGPGHQEPMQVPEWQAGPLLHRISSLVMNPCNSHCEKRRVNSIWGL